MVDLEWLFQKYTISFPILWCTSAWQVPPRIPDESLCISVWQSRGFFTII